MSSEAAKVIIDAEDLASKKIADAARNVERSVKNIKDVGGKAKASTEFIGTLATALGGSEIGGYAGQLAQMTDRISQFSEVSKAGKAGALAFKAGLAAVVATVAFQFGKAIGDAVFGTAKLTREFERTKEAARELNDELAKSRDRGFENQKEDIELIRDPKEKRAAQEALFKQLENDVQGITQQLKESQKTADEWADAWQITGDRKAFAEEAQKQVELDKQRLAQAKAFRDELRGELSERTRINEEIRAANEAAKKAEEAEKASIARSDTYLESLRKQLGMLKAAEQGKAALFGETAAQNTFGDAAKYEAEQLLAQIEAMKEAAATQKAIDDAKEKAAQKAIDDAKRIEDIKQREIDRLKEQRIELEKGKEAARAFNLEQQGLDKATAAQLAKEQTRLDEAKQQAGKGGSQIAQSIQVVESRLLTRGKSEDINLKIADNTRASLSELQKINRRAELEAAKKSEQAVKLEVKSA